MRADGEGADGLVLHVPIVVEKDEVEMNVGDVVVGHGKEEAFVVHGRLRRSLDRTSFLHQTLLFVVHVDFEVRI